MSCAARIAESLKLALFFRLDGPLCSGTRLPEMAASPYKVTPIFDEETLPAAIRSEHRTKSGVWGLLQILEGEAHLVLADSSEPIVVTPGNPALIPPQGPHHVVPHGAMRMRVEFYHERPDVTPTEWGGNG